MIDGDRAALEQQVQPQDVGQGAMGRRIVGRERDASPQQRERLVMVEVVGEATRPGAAGRRLSRCAKAESAMRP